MYNNRCLIIINVIGWMLFGPIFAVLYSLPASMIFGMVATCDCFCIFMDMQTAGVMATILLPLRLVQMLIVMVLTFAFNVVFWALFIIPAYLLVFTWGFRMIYYWSCGRTKKPKVVRRRISKAYNREEL